MPHVIVAAPAVVVVELVLSQTLEDIMKFDNSKAHSM